MSKSNQTLSAVCMSAFAGGCLVVSIVMMPGWREMDYDAFLDWFSENGARLGLTIFGGLSSLCIVATLVLLPIYFAEANALMLSRTIQVSEVGTELES